VNTHFSKAEIQMTSKYMKKMLYILSHQENTRYYLTPIRIVIIKKTITNAGKDMEKGKPLYNIGGNVN
jgi:hypothetical protein